MEFKEFSNPESKDYDITSCLDCSDPIKNDQINPYTEQLIDLIGILENISEAELLQNYGITLQEYFNPNLETINKVRERFGVSRK